MQTAVEQISGQDVLLTTDADAVTPPEWIAANLQAISAGADIVCGQAIIDPGEGLAIPTHLHADDALECRLLGLLDAMAWRLDPELHDPRHANRSIRR
jgi:Glycosyl transferase family 2